MREKSLRLSPVGEEIMASAAADAAIGTGLLGHHPAPVDTSLKETIVSITIAFVVAFVFRGFVVEPFLIPTGSMAPTLMGAHMRFDGPRTGFDWAVGPWSFDPGPNQFPTSMQHGPNGTPVVVTDPMSRETLVYRLSRERWRRLHGLAHTPAP